MKKWIIVLSSLILLIGCGKGTVFTNGVNPSDPAIEVPELTLTTFFPNEPIVKHFEGIGNEFAQYTEYIYKNEGNYFPTIMDNGGNRVLRIYKVTNTILSMVYEQDGYYEDGPLLPSSLEEKFIETPILNLPLTNGQNIGEWTVLDTKATLSVPLGTFHDIIVIEKHSDEGSIIRQYWAPKYGKIKDEFIIEDVNGDSYEVTSELKTVE